MVHDWAKWGRKLLSKARETHSTSIQRNMVEKRRRPVADKAHLRLKGIKGDRNTFPKEGSNMGKMRKVIPG
jgi:hypothetical protein